MENEKKIFRSRISVLLISLALAPCILLGPSLIMTIPGMCIMGGVLLLFVVTCTGIQYIISEDKLVLRVWVWFMFKRGMEISDIASIKRTYNPSSSYAASMKRLSIHFRTRRIFLLISPVKEKEFIEALKTINPTIDVRVPEETGKWWRIWDWDI